ncbi:Translin-1 [Coemansia nantahalensis]|uniref:Translin-1 n=2 Tax=Coemansia TaxID=4863 RepID=A0ACC1KY36_9FUNG|nr:Translin-1 [Coemansia nantahalensis]KAJ2771522.1 Translin-1 [Coemansia nantahalensis]KAJ2797260.1 Translin-1 [Coemansia helicoidea]
MDHQIFIDLQDRFDQESEQFEGMKGRAKELDRACRVAAAQLSKAHALPQDKAKEVADGIGPQFDAIRENVGSLAALVTPASFYRLSGMWTNALQTACAQIAFAVYLAEGRLATPEDVERRLGCKVNTSNEDVTEFMVSLEEYLHGLISLFSELSRLAVNSVIVGDVQRPQEISAFASELYSGFQLLNLKNDSLRRRFDSIKYEVKKIEEVLYDLRVRGLATA